MKSYSIIRLEHFRGGLHLARGLTNSYDKTLGTLHSDTIKSAIFVKALQLFGDTEVDKSFLEGFTISSAFPFFKSISKGAYFYFFPKPELTTLPIKAERTGIKGFEKKIKRIRFIEKGLFTQILKGESNITADEHNFSGVFLSGFDLKGMLADDGCEDLMTSATMQHVQIARDYASDSTPYYVDKIYFHRSAGLYFMIEFIDERLREKVMSALRLLADSGIGTDRNSGNGHFSIAADTIQLDLPNPLETEYQLAISLYCPNREEINNCLSDAYYRFVKRGGYISSPRDERFQSFRKKSVYMFTEGSLFPRISGRTGKVEDLTPDIGLGHRIYRDGRSIFLPIKL